MILITIYIFMKQIITLCFNCQQKSENIIINHNLYFYETKILNIQYTTINGQLDGEYLEYDKNSKLTCKMIYVNGKLHGTQTYF